MKNIFKVLSPIVLMVAALQSCDDVNEKMGKYSGEIVYPAKFDTIFGHIGYERVELDLMENRIPSSQIQLGKAVKTVVEYDNGAQQIVIDSVVSWVNITGLTESRLYRFHVYTMDDKDNKSVAQEIALIPYTREDAARLVIAEPRIQSSPSSAVIDWPNGISSVLLDYDSLFYSYTDKDGGSMSGKRGQDSRFFAGNLEAGSLDTIKVKYRITPKVNNEPIIESIEIEKNLVIDMPVGSTPFMPAEEAVLRENGVTSFTSDDVASITRLVYPVHANSLQDILYFSNLAELDFTSWSLPTPVLSYPSSYPNHEVGGTSWYPFMRKGTDITEGKQILQDLLESGLLTRVKYYPHSMGLDDVLAPYVASGVVELLPLPAEVLIPQAGFYLNGLVQSYLWDLAVTFNPGDAPSPAGHQYIYKITLLEQNPTFCLALPVEYMFNVDEYKYLKMSVYAPAKSALAGWLENYQKIWIRPMNNLWGHPGNNPSPSSGQQLWNSNQYEIPDGDLQQWATITFDLSNSVGTHNRLIAINPGCELTPAWSMLVFYFADIRFTKE